MDSKIEAELRFQIVSLEKRIKDMESDLSGMKESVKTLRRDMLATIRTLAPDSGEGGAH